MRAPTLTGEMVRLRPIGSEDADAAWRLYTDPETRRLSGARADVTREDVEDWCATVDDLDSRFDWAITLGDRPEMVGEVVLEDIDPDLRAGNVRIRLGPGHRGRGYAREATILTGHFAFRAESEGGLGLHRLALGVLSINPRGFALYESLGFVMEGRARHAHLDGGRYCDKILMSMLEDEYLQVRSSWS